MKANPLRLFDSKSPETQAILDRDAPLISDYISGADREHFEQVQAGLKALDIPVEYDPRLVRGLDYYTRTTFEITSRELGAQDALRGGRRYDELVKQLGGPDIPAVGFAAGVERMLVVAGDSLKEKITPGSWISTWWSWRMRRAWPALTRAQELRASGYTVVLETLRRSAKAQLREANRSGARAGVILGEDEVKKGTCTVKGMGTGEQEEVPHDKLAEHLDAILHPGAGELLMVQSGLIT